MEVFVVHHCFSVLTACSEISERLLVRCLNEVSISEPGVHISPHSWRKLDTYLSQFFIFVVFIPQRLVGIHLPDCFLGFWRKAAGVGLERAAKSAAKRDSLDWAFEHLYVLA
jgi:hypothetical protein